MEELKETLKEIKSYMPYGRIKALASKYGVKEEKAYDILSGRIEVTEAEEEFVFACFDVAKARKARLAKLTSF
jgi:hypothetical protein